MSAAVLRIAGFAALLLMTQAGTAAVRIVRGATPIIDGQARSASDITVVNEKLAFALAIGTPVPYGVPRGAIIDIAPVSNGRIGHDCVVFADFIPNNWSAWPNSYQHVEILEHGPSRAVIKTVRDFGAATVTSIYTLEANADVIQLKTTLTNGGKVPLRDLLSGHTLWPSRGFLFAVPGLAGLEQGSMRGALASRVVAYDEHWSVTLQAAYADTVGDASKDLYLAHSLAPGATRVFEASLQVGASADLQAVIQTDILQQHRVAGSVAGSVVAADGKGVDRPVVVVEKQGKPYAWVLGARGHFALTLAEGDYQMYATAKNYAQSPTAQVRVTAGEKVQQNFSGLQNPARIEFAITNSAGDKPLDARVTIQQGQKPLVEFLGRKIFFTELGRAGKLDVAMAPGDYVFSVSADGGFLGPRREVAIHLDPGQSLKNHTSLERLFDAVDRHWFSADLHHHANQAEAVTPPEDLARSQLAAGLDVLFVSDHDSTANHSILQRIADGRGVPFIPSMEFSASWGHFNAYPLVPGSTLAIDTGTADIGALFAEARREGALVIQVNHPFIPYGYFTSVERGVAPGGFNPGFDLLEINASAPDDDTKVLQRAWASWSTGRRYFLAGGTDTHDVWNEESGRVRTFAHVDGPLSARSFAEALRMGHGYVTSGPLLFPDVNFGDSVQAAAGQSFKLGFELESVLGLKQVLLIADGHVTKTESFSGGLQRAHVDFSLTTDHSTWYALSVEDQQGHKAYSDPIWLVVN